MKQGFFEIIENQKLVPNVYRMRLKGDTSAITAPGQFVNIKLEGLFLRRPISVCDVQGDVLTIIETDHKLQADVVQRIGSLYAVDDVTYYEKEDA